MKKIFLLSLVIGLFACNNVAQENNKQESTPSSKLLTPTEFKTELAKSDDYYLIDVRTPAEFSQGNIEGSVNMNISDGSFEKGIEALDKKKPVYVYCAAGGRSGRAAKILKEKGFQNIIDLKGGYSAW